ncbi:hypothetical protein CSUI_005018 [Cystoisospora suis]|uniref:Uncharacterized protein n=1 Tax=Cystoisospora suis TaxID=483139 RepID=A0A2C6KZG8_9APIC|nr:hypothetical protein CSUI_005018 [Cystoisospora suis]
MNLSHSMCVHVPSSNLYMRFPVFGLVGMGRRVLFFVSSSPLFFLLLLLSLPLYMSYEGVSPVFSADIPSSKNVVPSQQTETSFFHLTRKQRLPPKTDSSFSISISPLPVSPSSADPPCPSLSSREENLHDFFLHGLFSDTPTGSIALLQGVGHSAGDEGADAKGDASGDRDKKDQQEAETRLLEKRRISRQQDGSGKDSAHHPRREDAEGVNLDRPRDNDVKKEESQGVYLEVNIEQVGSRRRQLGGASVDKSTEEEEGRSSKGESHDNDEHFLQSSPFHPSPHPMYFFERGKKVFLNASLASNISGHRKHLFQLSNMKKRRALDSHRGGRGEVAGGNPSSLRVKDQERQLSQLSYQRKVPFNTPSSSIDQGQEGTPKASPSRRQDSFNFNSYSKHVKGVSPALLSAPSLQLGDRDIERRQNSSGAFSSSPSSLLTEFPSKQDILKCFNIPLDLFSSSSFVSASSPTSPIESLIPSSRESPQASHYYGKNTLRSFSSPFFHPSFQRLSSFSSTVLSRTSSLPSDSPSSLSSRQVVGRREATGRREEEKGEHQDDQENHVRDRNALHASSSPAGVGGTLLGPRKSYLENEGQRQQMLKEQEEAEEKRRGGRSEGVSAGVVAEEKEGLRFHGIIRQVVGVATDFDGTLTDYYRTIEKKEENKETGGGGGKEEEEKENERHGKDRQQQQRGKDEREKTTDIVSQGKKKRVEKDGDLSPERRKMETGEEIPSSPARDVLKRRTHRNCRVYSVQKDDPLTKADETGVKVDEKKEEIAVKPTPEKEFVDSTTSLLSMARKKSKDPEFYDGVADTAVQVYNRGRKEVLQPFERDVYSFFSFLRHHCPVEEKTQGSAQRDFQERRTRENSPLSTDHKEKYDGDTKREKHIDEEEVEDELEKEDEGEIMVGGEWLDHFVEVIDQYEEKMVNTENTKILLQGILKDSFHADFLEAAHAVDAIKPYALETLVSLHHYGIPITFISHSWSAHLLRVTLKQALINSLVHCFKQEQQEKQSSSAERNGGPLSKEEESIEKETRVDSRIEDGKSLLPIEEQQTDLLLPQEVDNQYRYRQTPHWIGLWAESIVNDMKFYANELEYDPKTGISTGLVDARCVTMKSKADYTRLAKEEGLLYLKEKQTFPPESRWIIFLGDTYSDLLGLLEADIGIIMGQPKKIMQYILRRAGIATRPLTWLIEHFKEQQKRYEKEEEERAREKVKHIQSIRYQNTSILRASSVPMLDREFNSLSTEERRDEEDDSMDDKENLLPFSPSENRMESLPVQRSTSLQKKRSLLNSSLSVGVQEEEEEESGDEEARQEEEDRQIRGEKNRDSENEDGVYTFSLPSLVCGKFRRYPCFCTDLDQCHEVPPVPNPSEGERREGEEKERVKFPGLFRGGERKRKNRSWCCRVLYVAQNWGEVQELLFGTSFKKS